jgi:hypothetical protein
MSTPNVLTELSAISTFLAAQGYQTTMQPADPPLILEQVLVHLGKTVNGQDLILHIAGIGKGGEDLFGKAEFADEYPDDFKFFQFTVVIPELADEASLGELARYILTLNANLDMANFGLMEQERVLFYRYVYISPLPSMNGNILIVIVTSIQFLLELFVPPLIEVAKGKKTSKQLLEEAKKAVQNIEFSLMK